MKPFLRIIHLSDLHFGDNLSAKSYFPGQEVHDREVAIRLTTTIKELSNGNLADSIRTIVTGDLTTSGSPSALNIAKNFVRLSDPQSAGLVGLNDSKSLLLPGNHDIWQDKRNIGLRPNSGCTDPYQYEPFSNLFLSSAPDAEPPIDQLASAFPYRVQICEHPRVVFFGLDSTRVDLIPSGFSGFHPRKYHLWACGLVDQEQMKRLRTLVEREFAVSPSPPILIAGVHHPLAYRHPAHGTTDQAPCFERSLLNMGWIQRELAQMGFCAVLCGHQHRDFHAPIQPSLGPLLREGRRNATLHVLSAGAAVPTEELPSKILRYSGNLVSWIKRRPLQTEETQFQNSFAVYDLAEAPPNIMLTRQSFYYPEKAGWPKFRARDKATFVLTSLPH